MRCGWPLPCPALPACASRVTACRAGFKACLCNCGLPGLCCHSAAGRARKLRGTCRLEAPGCTCAAQPAGAVHRRCALARRGSQPALPLRRPSAGAPAGRSAWPAPSPRRPTPARPCPAPVGCAEGGERSREGGDGAQCCPEQHARPPAAIRQHATSSSTLARGGGALLFTRSRSPPPARAARSPPSPPSAPWWPAVQRAGGAQQQAGQHEARLAGRPAAEARRQSDGPVELRQAHKQTAGSQARGAPLAHLLERGAGLGEALVAHVLLALVHRRQRLLARQRLRARARGGAAGVRWGGEQWEGREARVRHGAAQRSAGICQGCCQLSTEGAPWP